MFKPSAARPYRTPSIDLENHKPEKQKAERKPREDLGCNGAAFLQRLQSQVQLDKTAKLFPHIINRLATYLNTPPLMIKSIDELLMPDDVSNREGFPFAVVIELTNLKTFYSRVEGRR